MKKDNALFFIMCILELAVVGAVALMFPHVAHDHPVAFILAGILVVVSSVAMGLLNLHHKEERIIREKEHELEKTKLSMQIDLALRGIGGGFVIQKDDEEKTFVYVSESLAALLGYTVEEFLEASNNKTSGIVPKEDFANIFGGQTEEKETLRFHVRCKDGSLKWISSRGKYVINEKGERERYSFNHDITQLEESRKQMEKAAAMLRLERQMYRDALVHDCDYAYIVNVNENRIRDVYKSGFLEKYDFEMNAPYDETMSRVVEAMKPVILHGMSQFHLTAHYIAAYEQGKRMVEVEYYIPDSDLYKRKSLFLSKDEFGVMYVFVVTHDITAARREELETERSLTQLAEVAKKVGSGNLDVEIEAGAPGLVGVLADVLRQTITHLKQSIDQLNQQATQDPLTGVKNKRAWQDKERQMNEQIHEGKAEFAIVVCDINGLKQVNDTIGHEAGDSLIIRASRHICKTFLNSPVYRIGGDEFTVILEGKDLADWENLQNIFYLRMEAMARENQGEPPVSIALGISHYQPKDTSFAEIFRRADDSMYKNKMVMKEKNM